jgi:1-acyl-sn-glycerol-3-phosphate acyltransferase
MRIVFRVLWRAIRLLLHVLLGALLTLLTARRNRQRGDYRYHPGLVSWWHERLLHILQVRVEATGHRPHAPALLVSNHVSWLDIPVLGSLTHSNFLSKDEVRRWPVIGWLAAASGTMFIRRGRGEASTVARQIADHLDSDGLLTLFPEGTTTDGSEVRPFFPRLFASAIESGAPVVPVALRYHIDGELDPIAPYVGDQSLLANLWGIIRRDRTEVLVSYMPALALAGLERKVAAEKARSQIALALSSHTPHHAATAARHQAG